MALTKAVIGTSSGFPQAKKRDGGGGKHGRERLDRVYGDTLMQFLNATV